MPDGQQFRLSPSDTTTSCVVVAVRPLGVRAVQVTTVRPEKKNDGALLVTVTGNPQAEVAGGGVSDTAPQVAA